MDNHDISMRIIEDMKERCDGGTYSVLDGTRAELTDGYYVSLDGFNANQYIEELGEWTLDEEYDIGADIAYVLETAEYVFGKRGYYLGIWFEDDGFGGCEVYIDLSVWVEDYDTAVVLGLSHDQTAIYDIARQEAVYL